MFLIVFLTTEEIELWTREGFLACIDDFANDFSRIVYTIDFDYIFANLIIISIVCYLFTNGYVKFARQCCKLPAGVSV